MRWIKANCAFAATGPYSSLYEDMDRFIVRFQCYQQELGLAMEMLVDWEAAHHVPRTWDNLGDARTSTFKNRYRLKPSKAASSSRFPHYPSPLFIFTVQDIFRFISYLRTQPLMEMLGDVVPDWSSGCHTRHAEGAVRFFKVGTRVYAASNVQQGKWLF
ncbi:hypothetical protein L198_07717 [Cryptococcus wingfieldii CBS 7118]|uniref:Uncharacterized protein n=1 Tax=Cryptococcus wingfieldii CBS 7118 TaxID=1295528 RepID=A0A1E3I2B7_9TREE|nr:hypothetical protein L198_07717 [Cryptococcus wingfieldii CBS 7118]ODN82495.1 hypothetical protein L198_07717 [Cryptococcus wingfieldii CBS 7118]